MSCQNFVSPPPPRPPPHTPKNCPSKVRQFFFILRTEKTHTIVTSEGQIRQQMLASSNFPKRPGSQSRFDDKLFPLADSLQIFPIEIPLNIHPLICPALKKRVGFSVFLLICSIFSCILNGSLGAGKSRGGFGGGRGRGWQSGLAAAIGSRGVR